MATSSSLAARVSLRLAVAVLLLLAAFYVCRPLYWKLSATIHDIRHNKQTVKQGISNFVLEAQRSVGWIRDESDSGSTGGRSIGGKGTSRRILWRN